MHLIYVVTTILHAGCWSASPCRPYSMLYPFVRAALVNAAAGAVVVPGGRVFSVMAFTVSTGRITQIDALVDPERLARLDLTVPAA